MVADYYDDNVYQGWDVLEAREKTTTITLTTTVATTTTTETTTTTSTAVISQQHKAISVCRHFDDDLTLQGVLLFL